MHINFTDRHGNGLISKSIKFYKVGETVTPVYTATTDSYGRINLEDYDGLGTAIAEGIYDVKCVACADDLTDQWEYKYLISKGKKMLFSDDNLNYIEMSDADNKVYVYKNGTKMASIDVATG